MNVPWQTFKNDHLIPKVLCLQYFDMGDEYMLLMFDGMLEIRCNLKKDDADPDYLDFFNNFKPTANKKIGNAITKLPESQPFAEPTYRTKDNGTAAPVIVENGANGNIDYTMPAELYVSGGTMIIKNVQFGDWVECTIMDPSGTIPAPYRPVTCEAWPLVNTYIIKKYLEVYDSGSIWYKQGVDTRPLVAKLTPGLVLRITYHAVGGDQNSASREVLVNYFLCQKL